MSKPTASLMHQPAVMPWAVLTTMLPLLSAHAGSLSGRVANSFTGAGIPGAHFRACQDASGKIHCGDTNYAGVSDISGAYRIAGLPDGQYTILDVEAKGFQGTIPLLTVTVSGDSQFELRLAPNANIRGRVFDPDRRLAAGARVKLEGRGEAVTNQDGEFALENVTAGCCFTLSAMPATPGATKDDAQVVTTYYPSALTTAEAANINITGGDSSYDIRLQIARARAVKGTVLGVDGKPVTKARVVLSQNDGGRISFLRGSPTGLRRPIISVQPVDTSDDGTFTFPPVIEGEWTLSASILRDRQLNRGATRVSVSTRDAGPSDIPGVQIQLAKPFDLDVTADWGDAGPPLASDVAFVSTIPLDPGSDPLGAGIFTIEAGKTQRFHLFPGRYFIGEGRKVGQLYANGFYAAAAMLDGRDVLNQMVELSGPASIKMVYKSGGGSVRGTVEKGANATVVLIANATPAALLGYMGRCDENGTFVIPDLPPGEYTAVALMADFFVDLRTPPFATAAARDGRRIKVEAGIAAQADLRISVLQ